MIMTTVRRVNRDTMSTTPTNAIDQRPPPRRRRGRLPSTSTVFEITDSLTGAGLTLVEDRRVGDGPDAFHLLVCELQ
jgi:hypothetical protein